MKHLKKVERDLNYMFDSVSVVNSVLSRPLTVPDLRDIRNRLQTVSASLLMLQDSVTRLTIEMERSNG